jgi:hypothetical protein
MLDRSASMATADMDGQSRWEAARRLAAQLEKDADDRRDLDILAFSDNVDGARQTAKSLAASVPEEAAEVAVLVEDVNLAAHRVGDVNVIGSVSRDSDGRFKVLVPPALQVVILLLREIKDVYHLRAWVTDDDSSARIGGDPVGTRYVAELGRPRHYVQQLVPERTRGVDVLLRCDGTQIVNAAAPGHARRRRPLVTPGAIGRRAHANREYQPPTKSNCVSFSQSLSTT